MRDPYTQIPPHERVNIGVIAVAVWMNRAKTLDQVKSLFAAAYPKTKGYQDDRQWLKEQYNRRKAELEAASC